MTRTRRFLFALTLALTLLTAGAAIASADAWPTSPVTQPNDPIGPGV